jgi:hypothetical protein
MNSLLLWMSAKHHGSLRAFRAKVAEYVESTSRRVSASLLSEWNLSKLGHAEFRSGSDKGGWRIAPPVLSGSGTENVVGVLSGARTPKMMAALESSGVSLTVTPQRDAPDVVRIAANSRQRFIDAAACAGVYLQWNTPLAILAAAVPIVEQRAQEVEVPIGGWVVSRFSRRQLAWTDSSIECARDSVRDLFRFVSPQRTQYLLVENGRSFDCGSAEGKYSVLSRKRNVLSYSAEAQTMAMPFACRPPNLIERALVLCSGELPAVADGALQYQQIPRVVAQAAAALLSQKLS